MTAPYDDADRARGLASTASSARSECTSNAAAQVYATLHLADAIRSGASLLAGALVEAARIRAGKRS